MRSSRVISPAVPFANQNGEFQGQRDHIKGSKTFCKLFGAAFFVCCRPSQRNAASRQMASD
jgi:hypothetical protein